MARLSFPFALLAVVAALSLSAQSASIDKSLPAFGNSAGQDSDDKFGFVDSAPTDSYDSVKDAVFDVIEDLLDEHDVMSKDDDLDDLVSDDEKADDEAVDEFLGELADEIGEGEGDELADFPLDDLDEEAMEALMEEEEKVQDGQISVHVAKKMYLEAEAVYTSQTQAGSLRRRKRIAPLVGRVAFSVGRALFRRFARGRVSRSGSRITRQYNGRGNYQDAMRDFNRLRPDNVRPINSGRIQGHTGTLGNGHRVTVRNGSSGNSRPTLEIQSHGGNMRRKFRYNN